VTAAGPPRHVYGSDGRTHVDYDLLITNAFTAEVTLSSLAVSGDGTTLLRLTGEALAEHPFEIVGGTPSDRIPASATRVPLVDVALPHSAGRRAPQRLMNRIDYTILPRARFRAAIGSTTVYGPVLRTTGAPMVIASPLRGSGWFAGNGCRADPNSAHRNTVLSANGTYKTIEVFALDWVKLVNGFYFRGDGSQLSDYFDFGAPIYVVSAINDRPEAPLGSPASSNPTVHTPEDFGGNLVVEEIEPGVYAAYAHMQPGSVTVRPGQHLRTGGRSADSATPATRPCHICISASRTGPTC
jgi:hypothetical protein